VFLIAGRRSTGECVWVWAVSQLNRRFKFQSHSITRLSLVFYKGQQTIIDEVVYNGKINNFAFLYGIIFQSAPCHRSTN
jgi:hypothetical protein